MQQGGTVTLIEHLPYEEQLILNMSQLNLKHQRLLIMTYNTTYYMAIFCKNMDSSYRVKQLKS